MERKREQALIESLRVFPVGTFYNVTKITAESEWLEKADLAVSLRDFTRMKRNSD